MSGCAVQCSAVSIGGTCRRYVVCTRDLEAFPESHQKMVGNTKEYTTGLMQHAIWIGREARENGVRQ